MTLAYVRLDRGGDMFGSLGTGRASFGTITSVTDLGNLAAAMTAASVTAQTGVVTTADQIIQRSQEYGIQDTTGGLSAGRDATLVALARGFLDESGNPTPALERVRPIIEALPGGSPALYRIITASVDLGLHEALANGALAIGRDLFSGSSGVLERLFSLMGGMETVNRISRFVGEAVSDIQATLPLLGAASRLSSGIADVLNRWLMPPAGQAVPVREWARDGLELWRHLCRQEGLDPDRSTLTGNTGNWEAKYNPFLAEVTIRNVASMSAFVRAIDIGRYGFPDWRQRFVTPTAMAYVRGAPAGPEMRGRSADWVVGCPCATGGMVRPFRWRQGRPEFRAAMVAAAYLTGNVGCVSGVGSYDPPSTGGSSGDPYSYGDTNPWYDLGYQPKLGWTNWLVHAPTVSDLAAGGDAARIYIAPPQTPPYGTEGSQYARIPSKAACCCASDTDDRRRNAFIRWLSGGVWIYPLGREPQEFVPKMSPPPMIQTVGGVAIRRGGPGLVAMPATRTSCYRVDSAGYRALLADGTPAPTVQVPIGQPCPSGTRIWSEVVPGTSEEQFKEKSEGMSSGTKTMLIVGAVVLAGGAYWYFTRGR